MYLYRNCILENRWPRIIEKIEAVHSDVIFLQEVEEKQFDDLTTIFSDYKSYYMQRPGNVDGCATLINSRFEVVDVEKKVLSKPKTISDRDNVCILVLGKINGKYVIFANTHILYNPKRGLIKASQIITILEAVYSLMHKHDCFGCNVVMGGDFNLSPTGLLYHFITEGSLKISMVPEASLSGQIQRDTPSSSLLDYSEMPSEISHPFVFNSAYKAVQFKNNKPWKFTQDLKRKNGFNGLFVDYIFYGHLSNQSQIDKKQSIDYKFSSLVFDTKSNAPKEALKLNSLKLIKIGDLPDPELVTIDPMPSKDEPSDHLMVSAEFELIN